MPSLQKVIGLVMVLLTMLTANDSWGQTRRLNPYSGVTPEGGDPPSPKPPPTGYQYITWPGFQITNSGSDVFLQLTGPVHYKVHERGLQLWITIDKVMVYLNNNLRRVITRHFSGTPVSYFQLRRLRGGRMRLEITLQRRSNHTVTLRPGTSYQYLNINFPAPLSQS